MMVIGKTMFFQFTINASSVAGSPSFLQAAVPGGYTLASSLESDGGVYANDNGTVRTALVQASVDGSKFRFLISSGTWATSTNLTDITWQGFFEVL